MNIPIILEEIKTTDNVNVLLESLTSLAAMLKLKIHYDEIIKSDVVYTTAHTILSQGLDDNSMRVLCFLRTMLRATTQGEGAALARDRIRHSGCLQDMANMFLGTMMMYEETWKTLCECLIESCRFCEDNQSYCSRLIPTCIQRCDARNTEILKLLHTLLLNHTPNVHLFIESNGLSIFTRDTIRDKSRMELLSILVQDSTAAGLLMHDTALMEFLCMGEHFKDSSKMTEWASVILFHIASHIEGSKKSENSIESMSKTMGLTDSTDTALTDFSVSFLIKSNWDTNMYNNIKTGKYCNLENAGINAKTQRSIGTIHNQINLGSSVISVLNENNFIPNYVSTPKKKLKTIKARQDVKFKHNFAEKVNGAFRRTSQWNNSASLTKQKLSMSARLYNIVNNSCISIYQTVGNLLGDLSRPFIKNENADYMKQQDFRKIPNNKGLKNCHARDLGINQKYLKTIVKKLKTGIHFYGCNFKKISRAMWPYEKHMTPRALYSIYRKYIVK